jgi:glycosyltransferase involved in cell wall biosynthesis
LLDRRSPSLAYLSFDTVPAPKGAAIHILAFARVLARAFGSVELITVSPDSGGETRQLEGGIVQTTLPAVGKNFLDRVLNFRENLRRHLARKSYDVIHFRSIFEGFPLVRNQGEGYRRLIFEVNGLPSIELKYRYPGVVEDRELLVKITRQEDICLREADRIITPSGVTGDYLEKRGIDPEKIRVIPNGVDLDLFSYRVPPSPRETPLRLLYFGTTSPWQGVERAIEALSYLPDSLPASLRVVGVVRPGRREPLRRLVRKLDLEQRVTFVGPVSQRELVDELHRSHATLAPLGINDRNCLQGCCPLKIIEAMAAGVPVIASDLPAVREIGESERDFLLVKPDSPEAIAGAIERLRDFPHLSRDARRRVETRNSWEIAGKALLEVYRELTTD